MPVSQLSMKNLALRRWGRRVLTLAIFAVVIYAPIHFLFPGGKAMAERDLAEGKFQLLGMGTAGRAQLLRDRYGVESLPIGCIRFTSSFAFENEYNAVQQSALLQRFGRDVVQECEQEAREMRRLATQGQR